VYADARICLDCSTWQFEDSTIDNKPHFAVGGAVDNVLARHNKEVASQAHRFNYEGSVLQSFVTLRQQAARYANFQMSDGAQQKLLACGLYVSDLATQQHGHPACKTLEQYLLRVVVPAVLKPLNGDITAYWMKPRKAATLANDLAKPLTLINPVIVPKDLVRFGSTATSFTFPQTPVAFIHDAAMFLSPSDIYDLFAQSPNLESLVATLILPPELLDGLPPVHREIYTFAVHGNNFDYYPDGKGEAFYTHSLDQLWWLRTNTITGPDLTWSS
jgi:hypothetical protein